MGIIQATTSFPLLNPPQPQPALTEKLQSGIARVSEEVNFYHQLLSWCLYNCGEEHRCTIENLRKEVSELRNSEIPVLAENLRRLNNGYDLEAQAFAPLLTITQIQHYFQRLESSFQALKSRIQKGFGNFTRVRIW